MRMTILSFSGPAVAGMVPSRHDQGVSGQAGVRIFAPPPPARPENSTALDSTTFLNSHGAAA
jgi:hypothetical protein